MINISAEDAKLFEQNGFSKEQVGATINHYRQQGLSDDEIQEKMNAKISSFGSNVTPEIEKPTGIDLTPSGLYKQALAGVLSPARAAIQKQTIPEAYQSGLNALEKFKPAGGLGDLAFDVGVYSKLPMLKGAGVGNFAGNAAIQGGVPMALESLKAGKNPLGGLAGGTAVGSAVQALPYVGKVLSKPASYITNKAVEALTGLKPETIKQVIKPNSRALNLTEKEAQNLLMDTTERVQKDYQKLMDNAGAEVQKAALNLPEDRGVFASSLKNSLDDIYNGYSTSGIKELNPAYNNAGDIYNDISALIDAGTTGEKVSAQNLNDIMGNLKNYPIDWSKTSAKDRQAILKQIYSDYARRLGNLSPELRKANSAYSKLANFENNEGIRQILKPNKPGDLVNPSSVLKNYNSTVTKGNVNRNIQDLENLLVAEGKQPFINDIDDVNAAMDLLKNIETGRNWLGLTTMAKGLANPALKTIRAYNSSNLPQVIENAKTAVTPLVEKLLTPSISRGLGRIFYGN